MQTTNGASPTAERDESSGVDGEEAVVDRSEVSGDVPPEAAAGGPDDAVETLPSAEAWEMFRRDL